MKERDAQMVVIIGRNGTGKSTFCEAIVKNIKGRALVVTFNGAPKIWRQYEVVDVRDPEQLKFKKGIRQVFAGNYETSHNKTDLFRYIYRNFRDGIVIFDDARSYIGPGVDQDKYLRRLIVDFRHRMLDIFMVVHSPSDIPIKVWGSLTYIFVGSTSALINKSQVKNDSADVIIEAQQEVNKEYLAAKKKNNNSHYGIFKLVQV